MQSNTNAPATCSPPSAARAFWAAARAASTWSDSALEVMRTRRLPVLALVVSQDASPDAPDFAETVEMVRKFAGQVPILSVGRGDERPWAEALLSLVLA